MINTISRLGKLQKGFDFFFFWNQLKLKIPNQLFFISLLHLIIWFKSISQFEDKSILKSKKTGNTTKRSNRHNSFYQQSSRDFRAHRFVREIDALGATYDVEVGREHISYISETLSDNIPHLTHVLMGILKPRWFTTPKMYTFEVDDAREIVQHQVHENEANAELTVFELLHQVAFRYQGLGRNLSTPYDVESIGREELADFFQAHFIPQNITIVGTGGVKHDNFVELVSKNLVPEEGRVADKFTASRYTGGEALKPAHGPTHVALGYQVRQFRCAQSYEKESAETHSKKN